MGGGAICRPISHGGEFLKTLSVDLETFSSADLRKTGIYRYVEAPDFEILLFGYSADDGDVHVVDLAQGEPIPNDILSALTDETVTKWAFNANFERICLSRYLGLPTGEYLDPSQWRCSMVWAAYLGLPLSLAGVGAVLKLDKQKLDAGKDLIKYFCQPCKPTKVNGGRTRNLPADAPDKWTLFKSYNLRDVEAEMAIQEKLSRFPVPDFVWDEYHHDQEINDRGIRLDMTLVKNAITMDQLSHNELSNKMQELTELNNPNSVAQMKNWLADNGLETDSLGKKQVAELLEDAPQPLADVLLLRKQLAKSSVRKYQAMENCVCADGRARGMFMFYGANRTGRFSGRLIQLQNLPRNYMSDLKEARGVIRSGDYDTARMLYDSVPDVLSELIRTAFIPYEGGKFIVADFSAIEARVIAWLAGEEWKTAAFSRGDDIYCATASQMFHVPVEKHGVNSHLRQKGKIAELACIAEGQRVLTHVGLVPIENVTTAHMLWDGEGWVFHRGVIYKGEREVIEYEGLTATPDHLVWVGGQPEPIHFGVATSSRAHLAQTGNGGRAIQLGQHRVSSKSVKSRSGRSRVYDIQDAGPHHRFTVSGKLVHNCGYGGSVGALKAMGALEMDLSEEELKPLVDAWRASNPNIVQLWWDVDKAVMTCVVQRIPTQTHGIRFTYESGFLFITLPSGRRLAYVKPRIDVNRFGGESVTYEGIGSTKKWERLESFGGKCVENIIQGISRDILCYAMQTLRCCKIVAHVHDEIIIEADPRMSLEAICRQMGRTPPWAPGLELRADGFITDFYKKD